MKKIGDKIKNNSSNNNNSTTNNNQNIYNDSELDLEIYHELFNIPIQSRNIVQKKNICNAGVAFLKCAYHDVVNLVGNKYIAHISGKFGEHDITYYLEPYTYYYKLEELVEKTARQYGVKRPTIFSPLSRRAVNIKVDFGELRVSKFDEAKIDFKLEENNLLDILQTNKTLVWNIEIVDEHRIPRPKENINKKIVPLFENIYQIYEFSVEENEFIYLDASIGDVKRFGNCIYMNLSEYKCIDDIDTRYYKLKIDNYTQAFFNNNDKYYWNFYKFDRIYKERIRTEADIDYVLGFFENEITKYLGVKRTIDNNKAIRTYEDRDSYHYSKNKHFRSSAIGYVRFEKSEHWLFEDYISYIITYMNYYYPEFYWVGVV